MSPSLLDFLRHIEYECDYVLRVSEGKTKKEIISDETLSKAIVRSLEIIGEAVKHLPEDFKIQYPHLDWKEMAGMRNKLIHHYFGIEYDVVYNTVLNDIPELAHEIKRIIEMESKEG